MNPGSTVQRCAFCSHYYITHDPRFPYGCRALDFKSQREPRLDVSDASGRNCLYFLPNPRRQRS